MTEFALYTTYCDRCNPAKMINPEASRLNEVEVIDLPNGETVLQGGGWIQCSREAASLIGWTRIENGEDLCPGCMVEINLI